MLPRYNAGKELRSRTGLLLGLSKDIVVAAVKMNLELSMRNAQLFVQLQCEGVDQFSTNAHASARIEDQDLLSPRVGTEPWLDA